MRCILAVLISFFGTTRGVLLYAQPVQWPMDTFPTHTHQTFSLQQMKNHAATLVLFLDPDCPVTQKYGATIRRLYQKWQRNDINIVAVYPVVGIDSTAVADFAAAYRYEFNHVPDPKLRLARHLQASITPEAFVLDSLGQVRYQGAIDNWFYELGRYRRVITEHYVDDALTAYLQGEAVPVAETEAIGCFIGTGMVEEHHHKHR